MFRIPLTTISRPPASNRRGPGKPSQQTPNRIRQINRLLVQAAITGQPLPSDQELAQRVGGSERSVRRIRASILGLDRHELKRWQERRPTRDPTPVLPSSRTLVCTTPFAGL